MNIAVGAVAAVTGPLPKTGGGGRFRAGEEKLKAGGTTEGRATPAAGVAKVGGAGSCSEKAGAENAKGTVPVTAGGAPAPSAGGVIADDAVAAGKAPGSAGKPKAAATAATSANGF